MLTESAPPVADAAILDELAGHMRLSAGFAADQSAEVGDAFIAAVSHLEATLGLCLVPRRFVWRGRLGADGQARAPMSPVKALVGVDRILSDGAASPLDVTRFSLDRRATRTMICGSGLHSSELEFEFDAGFGEDWSATPGALRRAALMLAAHFFDQRHAAGDRSREAPFAVASLIAPWRSMRLTIGAAG